MGDPISEKRSATVHATDAHMRTTSRVAFNVSRHELASKLANPERRAGSVNAIYDRQFAGSHGNKRHGAQTSRAQHDLRIMSGRLPEGGRSKRVRESSRWMSQQIQLAARHAAQNQFLESAAPPSINARPRSYSPQLGAGHTGYRAVRASHESRLDISHTGTRRAKVILRHDGGYLTDYPN